MAAGVFAFMGVWRLGRGGWWGIWGWCWFSCGVAHAGGCLISVFQGFSASTGKAFILAGDGALAYRSMGFKQFPDIS